MKRLILLAPLAIAILAAGCGSSSSSSSTTAAASHTSSAAAGSAAPSSSNSAMGTLTLSESEFKIAPASPTVHAGVVHITVKNTGAVTHALTVQTPAGPVSTQSIAPGASATLTVHASKPGKYTFFCPIPGHEQAGMKGTLVVS